MIIELLLHVWKILRYIQVSQNWCTNYLLPYRGCLNVHEKIWKKCFRQKNQLFLLLDIINGNTYNVNKDIFVHHYLSMLP
jgi:hypothetical protein